VIKNVQFQAGKLLVTDDRDEGREYDIVNYLRAADIPTGLTYTQVQAITALANLVAVLIRTLIAREVISEEFREEGELDLEAIADVIEQMGGDFGEPDLTVT